VQAMLADPARACVHVVATPEEMPVTEACTIITRLRESLKLPIGTLFMNRCRAPVPAGAARALEALDRLSPRADGDARLARLMRDAVDAAVEWESVQSAAIARLEDETGLAAARLPLISSEEFGRAEAGMLATMIDAAVAPPERAQ